MRSLRAVAYLWTNLLPILPLLLALSGCFWMGEPKQPIDAAYAECKRTCRGTCAADGTCLPPVIPAEDGK